MVRLVAETWVLLAISALIGFCTAAVVARLHIGRLGKLWDARMERRLREADGHWEQKLQEEHLLREQQVAALRSELAAAQELGSTFEQRLKQRVGELTNAIEQLAEREGDDLTRISGIGPVRCQRLVDAGIRSFSDIAAWDADDIATFADKVGAFAAVIEREDWVGQAAELARERGSETPQVLLLPGD